MGNMEGASKPPTVTERDHEYFRRLGEWKRKSHEEAHRAQLERSGFERLCYSFGFGGQEDGRSREDDDPGQFYERARRLGLYRA
jgi:hypothetical protein